MYRKQFSAEALQLQSSQSVLVWSGLVHPHSSGSWRSEGLCLKSKWRTYLI